MDKLMKVTVTEEEYNILINALNKARRDWENSSLAKKQYTDMYVRLMEDKYGKGSAVL